MFEKLNLSGNGTISWKEFTSSLEMINRWGYNMKLEDAINVFKVINVDDSDNVLTQDEFAIWASTNQLDLEDDLDD